MKGTRDTLLCDNGILQDRQKIPSSKCVCVDVQKEICFFVTCDIS